MLPESMYYNALCRAVSGNYNALETLRAPHGTWEGAWLENAKEYRAISPAAEWEKLEKFGVALFLREDPGYPALLREIPLAPFGLYVRGTLPDFAARSISIAGTRKATSWGTRFAHECAAACAERGVTVVSGLAFGIDAAAHKGCLDAAKISGSGTTIAVLANGVDDITPRSNEYLGRKIIENGGAIVSEHPLGTPPQKYNFLQRNRIVSGLSSALVLIEVPIGSGARTTARFALEQNRDVLVAPGGVYERNYVGSNQLIKEGAQLVTSPEDILQALGVESAQTNQNLGVAQSLLYTPENLEEQGVFAVLAASGAPVAIDKLVELTKLNIQVVLSTLSLLLLSNAVKETDQGFTI